jgi:hypothetical protein
MTPGTRAVLVAVIAGVIFGLLALALERNDVIALVTAVLVGVVAFFGTYSLYSEMARGSAEYEPEPRRWAIPFTPAWRSWRLVSAGRLEEAGERMSAARDWAGARRLILGEVKIRVLHAPLVHLLNSSRSLAEMQSTLPPETPEAFARLARETVDDVSARLWAKTATLARLSQMALPVAADAEVATEAQHIEELAQQVEDAATDLLKLALAGYDSSEIDHGTELLTAVSRKAKVLLTVR